MGLRSELLRHETLQRAASGAGSMREGARGDGVVRLQLALITLGQPLPVSTGQQTRIPDGEFGQETGGAVRAFQKAERLTVDGIVGPKTLARMDERLPLPERKRGCCSNGHATNGTKALSLLAGANFRPLIASASLAGITLPSGLRFLDSTQEATARAVFGGSLDFTRIVLSDATGLGARPFTVAVPLLGVHFVVINAGTFAPSRNLLIHELAHAWQSQHSINPKQFMVNSALSQAMADELISKFGVDASAYYYRPGKNFALYGAEQIACQVESGVSTILSTIRSLPAHVPHPLNEASLSLPRWETRGAGVTTTC